MAAPAEHEAAQADGHQGDGDGEPEVPRRGHGAAIDRLAKDLQEMGKDVRLLVYPKTDHAFFNNTGKNYNAEAAEDAWQRTVAFFKAHLK